MPDQHIPKFQEHESKLFYGYIIVAVVFILQVIMISPLSSFGVFFKPILNDFDWSRALVSGAFSLSSFIRGIAAVLMGALNDRFGPRVVMTLCGLLLGAGFLLMSRMSTAWELYLYFGLIVGIGMGGLISPQLSTIARWFFRQRSAITGLVIAGGGIGGIITPPIATWLTVAQGWRNSLAFIGIAFLVIIVTASQFLKGDPSQMGLLPYGQDRAQVREVKKSAEGLEFKEAVRTRQLWMICLMFFCFGFTMLTMMLHLVPHATDLGISATTAASIMSMMSVTIVVGSLVLGTIASRIGNRQAYVICYTLLLTALIWLLAAKETWALFLFSAIIGLGAGGSSALQSPMVADLFGLRSHGLILGVCTLCLSIGATVGPFVAGYIFDIRGNYQLAFLLCAIAAVVSLTMAVILRPTAHQSTPGYLAAT